MKPTPFIENLQLEYPTAWSWFKDWVYQRYRQTSIFKHDILSPTIIEQFIDMPFVCQLGFFLEFIEENFFDNEKEKYTPKDYIEAFEHKLIRTKGEGKQNAIIEAFGQININLKTKYKK